MLRPSMRCGNLCRCVISWARKKSFVLKSDLGVLNMTWYSCAWSLVGRFIITVQDWGGPRPSPKSGDHARFVPFSLIFHAMFYQYLVGKHAKILSPRAHVMFQSDYRRIWQA